jgi:hypothetical protein
LGSPISSFVPVSRRGNIPLESMPNSKLRRNTAVPSAADFYITADKVRRYCAVHKNRQVLIFQANLQC